MFPYDGHGRLSGVADLDRGGTITAWMATSEGASYIPLGVRIAHDVRLSITDPIIGHELTKASAEARRRHSAGGCAPGRGPREGSPGGAGASSLPMDRVMDWVGVVGARPVSVNPKEVGRTAGPDMSMLA